MKKQETINIPYLLMFALLQFPLRFQNFTFVTYIFIYLIPGLYLLAHLQWLLSFLGRIIRRGNFLPLVFLVLLFMESCIWPIFHETYEFSLLSLYWLKFAFLLIKNVFLVAYYEIHLSGTHKGAAEYIRYYSLAVSLYVFVSLIMLIPAIRKPCLSMLYLTKKNAIDLAFPASYTRFGWAGWSGFDLTIQCSVSCFFICLLFLSAPRKDTRQRESIGMLLFAFVGNMMYGRSGLVISLLILFMTLTYMMGRGNFRLLMRILRVSGALCFGIVIAVLYVPALHSWSEWAFSVFVNFAQKGEISDSTGSVQHLMRDMYWMPPLHTLLLGDGQYTEKTGSYYMHTDSGIMRQILFYGVINYAIGIMATIQLTSPLYQTITSKKHRRVSAQAVSWLLFLALMVPFEIKGETYIKLIAMIAPVAYLKNERRDLQGILLKEEL